MTAARAAQAYFIDRTTGQRHDTVTRRQLIQDGAFLWAPFSEQEHKRDRLQLQLLSERLAVEKQTLAKEALSQKQHIRTLEKRLASAALQAQMKQNEGAGVQRGQQQARTSPSQGFMEREEHRERERERESERARRQEMEDEIYRLKQERDDVEVAAVRLHEEREALTDGMRSTIDMLQVCSIL